MPVPSESDADAVRLLKDVGLQTVEQEELYGAVRHIKNRVIGSKIRKQEYIDVGILPDIVDVIKLKSSPISVEAAYICNSLAHGGREHVDQLIASGVVGPLVEGIYSDNEELIEACLKTLRTIYQYPNLDTEALWGSHNFVAHLIQLMKGSSGQCCAMILGSICKSKDHQAILSTTDILDNIHLLLVSEVSQTNMAALFCLSEYSYDNRYAGQEIMNNQPGLIARLFELMRRDQYILVQYNAAKCLTNLFRVGAVQEESSKTLILDTIVYLCLYEDVAIKHIGANLLHELIEQNSELQLWASYSQHLMQGLSKFFVVSKDPVFSPLLRAAAFKAFAALGETQEEIRRSIIEGEKIISHLKFGLEDPSLEVQVAALSCLHSLSRSVKQLRTSLLDAEVWQPLLTLIKTDDNDLIRTSSRTLCNFLIDFSPSKDILLEQEGTIELLSKLTQNADDEVKLNGVWALMNITYKANPDLRCKILEHFGVTQILETINEEYPMLKIKALGLLRNILCEPDQVDSIMRRHGPEMMTTLLPILRPGVSSEEEQEQVLCVFINIATGHTAKDYLMDKEEWLMLLLKFLSHQNTLLQIAATTCTTRLVKSDEGGCTQRQHKLKQLGFFKQLQRLLPARPEVSDRAKIALQYFQ